MQPIEAVAQASLFVENRNDDAHSHALGVLRWECAASMLSKGSRNPSVRLILKISQALKKGRDLHKQTVLDAMPRHVSVNSSPYIYI